MNPTLFISYSWTTPAYEVRVVELATELRDSGVDVILDKWDLKEGHDAHAFMERMVSDPGIKKVAILCDRGYAAKSDTRTGGVGTEAQIITPEVYRTQDQSKFVAIIMERDAEGRPYLPIYYKSRIYIDLSDASSYAEGFEQLLRWAYDKPVHKKPDLGQKPSYLLDDSDGVRLATSALFRRAMDALSSTLAFSGWVARGFHEAVEERARDCCHILGLPGR